ncbi:TetR/AcrR family transcriptional regulator [Actinomadura sp. 9N215]|uniref:TetR/AcrR family transcriptional regulator n=1 Tax=Actinomadura sp. 9N215 TaxID=3375150 RepID=UPI003788957A
MDTDDWIFPRGAGAPRQQRSRRSHVALLRAADECFGDTGWRGTSVERIASAAGTSVGTVYARFGSKRDLLLAVVAQRVGEITEVVNAADLADDPVAVLIDSMRFAVRRRRGAAGLLHAWSDACIDHPELGGLEERIRDDLIARLRETLTAFQDLPGLRPDVDFARLAIVICGLIEGLHRPPWSLLGDEEAAQTVTRIILHLCLRDDALPAHLVAGREP